MKNLGKVAGGAVALVVAIVLTAATYAIVSAVFPEDARIHELLFKRSWIQHANIGVFWLAIMLLVLKSLTYRGERSAFVAAGQIVGQREFQSMLIWSDADSVKDAFLDAKHAAHGQSHVFRRVTNAMERLKRTKSTTDLHEYFKAVSDMDAVDMDSSYGAIRFLLWLIPTLGFIGTVLGIGVAISGFGAVIMQADAFDAVKGYLPNVTTALGTAFDTTFLALVLTIIAYFCMSVLQGKEEDLLSVTDHFCFDAVCILFQEHSSINDNVVERLQRLEEHLVDAMHGDRAVLVQALRDDVPPAIATAFVRGLNESSDGLVLKAPALAEKLDDITAAIQKLQETIEKRPSDDGDAGKQEDSDDPLDTLRTIAPKAKSARTKDANHPAQDRLDVDETLPPMRHDRA